MLRFGLLCEITIGTTTGAGKLKGAHAVVALRVSPILKTDNADMNVMLAGIGYWNTSHRHALLRLTNSGS